jgi:hypothetical protein
MSKKLREEGREVLNDTLLGAGEVVWQADWHFPVCEETRDSERIGLSF